MQSLWPLWAEAALNVVVHAQIPLDQVVEIIYDLVSVLVQESLQLTHLLVVIEVLLVLRVKFIENRMVVFQSLNQLFCASLLGQSGCLLQLVVLACKTLIELRQLDFHVILAILLLIPHNLEDLILKLLLALHLQFLQLVKH